MNRLYGLIVLGLIVGWGARGTVGSRRYNLREKAQNNATHIKENVVHFVGRTTGETGTRARGEVDKATGKARDKFGEITGNAGDKFGEITGNAGDKIGEIRGNAGDKIGEIREGTKSAVSKAAA